jgi:hypothetical protein
MYTRVPVATGRKPKNRSGVTNDPRRLAADVDGRSATGRRFSDIYDLIALDFPGGAPPKIREIALLRYELEKAQSAGEATLEDVVRVHNLINRYEKALRLETRRKAETAGASPLSFRDKLMARRSGGGAP